MPPPAWEAFLPRHSQLGQLLGCRRRACLPDWEYAEGASFSAAAIGAIFHATAFFSRRPRRRHRGSATADWRERDRGSRDMVSATPRALLTPLPSLPASAQPGPPLSPLPPSACPQEEGDEGSQMPFWPHCLHCHASANCPI